MLARMEYFLVDRHGRGGLVVGGDRPTERGSLDELRSCADDGQQAQSSFGGHRTSLSDGKSSGSDGNYKEIVSGDATPIWPKSAT